MLEEVNLTEKNLGIYIHIPFCNGKCPYCNFYSISPNKDIIKKYVDTVCEKIKYWGNALNHTVDTVYLGGGTPSLLESVFIAKIIKVIKDSFRTKLREITMEFNPSDHKTTDFGLLKEQGLNRVSIGAQSLNDEELIQLGRRHNTNDIITCVQKFKKYGINNLSIDLIVGVPGQSINSLNDSINFCIKNNIYHVSSYLLKIEKNTPYFQMKDLLPFLNDDEQADLYDFMCKKFKKNNYSHYEISNFCIENFESIHNLKYWNCDEYIGIGPSAHSFIDGKRFYYSNSINEFINNADVVQDGIGGTIEEYCMLSLRLSKGLNNKNFYKKFRQSIPAKYFERAKKMVKYGLVTCNENEIKLTDKGFLLSNSIILNIIY